MEYDELMHCIRAVANATNEDEIYLFGSQSVFLHLKERMPFDARASRETDIMTAYNSEDNAYLIADLFGEESDFDRMYDLTIDGVLDENLPLPQGWEDRMVSYEYQISDERIVTIYVPDINDIATSKLIAHREKDREWLQAMYDSGYIDLQIIQQNVFKMIKDWDRAQYLDKLLQCIANRVLTKWQE